MSQPGFPFKRNRLEESFALSQEKSKSLDKSDFEKKEKLNRIFLHSGEKSKARSKILKGFKNTVKERSSI
jgi:hypothetical protein